MKFTFEHKHKTMHVLSFLHSYAGHDIHIRM